jgi:energy-coupling factor transport system substrate-specific component
MERLKRDFSTISLAMIPVAIAINIAIGQIVKALRLPLYLDSIGTVFVGAVAGPWVGALTGLLSNIIWALLFGDVTNTIPYAPVAAAIGFLAGVFGRYGWFKTWWRAILAGAITGVVASLMSAPITFYLFGGVVGTGMDVITAAFRSQGINMLTANFLQGLATDPLDKAISFFVVYLILRALPDRYIDRFSRADDIR